MEGIFRAIFKNGKLQFLSEDAEKYFTQYEGLELVVRFTPASKLSEKQKLFAYYHGPLLDCAVIGFTQAGYEGMDKVAADYRIRAEVGKGFFTAPDGAVEPYLISKEKMTAERLHKLVCDALFLLESSLGITPPDAQAYKEMKITKRKKRGDL